MPAPALRLPTSMQVCCCDSPKIAGHRACLRYQQQQQAHEGMACACLWVVCLLVKHIYRPAALVATMSMMLACSYWAPNTTKLASPIEPSACAIRLHCACCWQHRGTFCLLLQSTSVVCTGAMPSRQLIASVLPLLVADFLYATVVNAFKGKLAPPPWPRAAVLVDRVTLEHFSQAARSHHSCNQCWANAIRSTLLRRHNKGQPGTPAPCHMHGNAMCTIYRVF